jgi:hypothetical protein
MSTTKKRKSGLLSFDQFLNEELKNPQFAVEYMRASLRDGDQEDFSRAVRNVAKVWGSFGSTRPGLQTRKTFKATDAGKGIVKAKGAKDLFRKLGV